MAAGLTDHVWTLREVLLCRVPLGPQPQALSAAGEPDYRESERARCAQREAKQAQQDRMSRIGGTSAGLCPPRWQLQIGPSDFSAG